MVALVLVYSIGALHRSGENIISGFWIVTGIDRLNSFPFSHSLPLTHSPFSGILVSCPTVSVCSCAVREEWWHLFSKAEHLGGGSGVVSTGRCTGRDSGMLPARAETLSLGKDSRRFLSSPLNLRAYLWLYFLSSLFCPCSLFLPMFVSMQSSSQWLDFNKSSMYMWAER